MFDFDETYDEMPKSPCMMFADDDRWDDESWVNEQAELSAAEDMYEKGKETS
jgi:hypothetical protein